MARRDDSSLASLLLTQRVVDLGVEPLKATEYWQLHEATDSLGSLLGRSADEVAAMTSSDLDLAARVVSLLDGATAVALELENLEQAGVSVLTPVDESYPHTLGERLRRKAPPILYVAGDPQLLVAPGLGVVGSRAVDEAGADLARGAARHAVEHGLTLVSGGARGVDQISMRAALEADGQVVGILAESLLRRLREPETRSAILDGKVCLITPFKPTAGFSVASAMGRNKLIYALATATLVVASDLEKGGTWAGAVEALRQSIGPVIVWSGEGAGEGNRALIAQGAHELSDLDSLFPLDLERGPAPQPIADQLSLGL